MSSVTGFGGRVQIGTRWALALGCACLTAGCMHMETQRSTLEHKPQVITPEDSQQTRLVAVPEDRSAR